VILRETDQSHSSKGINAMTAAHDIDWPLLLAERLTTTHPDVLRELLATFIHTLMGAEADAVCGADYGRARPHPIALISSSVGPLVRGSADHRGQFRIDERLIDRLGGLLDPISGVGIA
jgi:hypothetical protein